MSDYTQQNIYVQNFMRSKLYDFSPDYSELIGRICAVESAMTMRDSASDFCAGLLTAFAGTSLYGKIDRVCLAMRVGFANELSVVDSANSGRCAENVMPRDYRCFVRPDSSLFSLREGEIRIYDEVARVADTFRSRQKPVQRSLGYIMAMGFNSGVCVPLHVDGFVRGFLFFNSMESAAFTNLGDEDYAVLNIVAMVAKLALTGSIGLDSEYKILKEQGRLSFGSQVFDEEEFALHLVAASRIYDVRPWRPSVKGEGQTDFLYIPATIAHVVTKLCSVFFSSAADYPTEIKVSCLDELTVRIQVPMNEVAQAAGLDAYKIKVASLASQLAYLRVSLQAGINQVTIEFPYDPVSRAGEDILYSVIRES
jgi:hypothetical protein